VLDAALTRSRRVGIAAALVAAAAGLGLAPAAQAATVPVAPSGLAASLGSGNVPVLVWADNSSDETGFDIERCTPTVTGCTFAPLATSPANVYKFADQTNPPLAAHKYRVRAVNAAGASAWTVATLPVGSAAPVAIMTATPTTGTAPVTVALDGTQSYGIDFGFVNAWSWSFGDGVTASGSTASHVYVVPGTYRVTLTVADTRGMSALTETQVVVAAPPAVVLPPSAVTAVSTVRRRADLTWTNAPGTTTTAVTVSRCAGATCTVFSRVATLPATATSWSDTGLRSGTTYRYLLTSWDVPAGVGASANPVNVRVR
jgi:titin